MSIGWSLIVAIVLLLANAIFVAVEFALIATQRSQLEPLAADGNRRAKAALASITDLNNQIAGAQLGITMATLALGFIAEPSLAKLLENTVLSGISESARHTIGLVIALTIVTFLHILLAEMVPKNIALADAPRTSMWLAPLHRQFVRLAGPLVWLLNGMSNVVLNVMGVVAVDERAEAKTPEELAALLAEARHGDVIDESDFALLSNTLELGGASIREGIVEWDRVDRAPATASVAELEQRLAESGHSRLVLVDDQDRPTGWTHAKDLLGVDHRVWSDPLPVGGVRPLLEMDPDTAAEDALERMQTARAHVVLATQPDGPVGIITLTDVLEVLMSGQAGATE